jgi:putative transposase
LLATTKATYPITLFSVCLMPHHVHLVVQPATDAALSPFMPLWMTSHVRRYPRHYHTHGHVWQGRFKRVPIQQDGPLRTVLRSVLRNPVRAGLVEHARDWPWSSLRFPHLRDPAPIEAPTEWLQWIDQPLFDHELSTRRTGVNRQQPFGAADWQAVIATIVGLESTRRQRGRPRKSPKQ